MCGKRLSRCIAKYVDIDQGLTDRTDLISKHFQAYAG